MTGILDALDEANRAKFHALADVRFPASVAPGFDPDPPDEIAPAKRMAAATIETAEARGHFTATVRQFVRAGLDQDLAAAEIRAKVRGLFDRPEWAGCPVLTETLAEALDEALGPEAWEV